MAACEPVDIRIEDWIRRSIKGTMRFYPKMGPFCQARLKNLQAELSGAIRFLEMDESELVSFVELNNETGIVRPQLNELLDCILESGPEWKRQRDRRDRTERVRTPGSGQTLKDGSRRNNH